MNSFFICIDTYTTKNLTVGKECMTFCDVTVEKDDDDTEKDGFFKRLLRDGKDVNISEMDVFLERQRDGKDVGESEIDGFFKRLLRDSKEEDQEFMPSSGEFKE
ncbi:hypothetical protein MKW98_017277 [Papaver atlanticum]|uniref:Uncharacterized protein n=1 Tax=Papaver atlanticum TaxID=357466 RepID=A0AAD4S3H0_9MAGN|nr:hypothetical protein MKW98_017277 [Papaver atlanticum]